ncbi:MAG: type II secretion system F family protein [Candidatus Aenigmatarchaeota archaeon]
MSIFKKKEIDLKKIEEEAKNYSPKEIKEPKRPLFERACKFAERTLKLKASENARKKMNESIMMLDMDITPDGVFSLSILTLIVLLVGILPLFLISVSLGVLMFFIPFIVAYIIYTYPSYLATVTKIRAADETIKVILYMVIYLRFNPQLEGALNFAAEHCHGPIGKDFKQILWGIETGRFMNINQAISSKMEKWLLWDKEFVESLNLILSITRMTTEDVRNKSLEKALSYILTSTYEKMKDYSQNLRSPITMIHSMGITFPLMGLIMFPMISIFLHDQFNPIYLAFGYIVVLPLILYFYLKRTISKRPGAFSFPDISYHPDLPPPGKYSLKMFKKKYFVPVAIVAIMVMFYVSIPGIAHFFTLAYNYFSLKKNPVTFEEMWKSYLGKQYQPEVLFSLTFYSLSIVWGIGLAVVIYCLGMSYQRLKIRNEIKQIEDEFQIALFNLADVLSSGIPIETALEEVSFKYKQSKMDKSPMYTFFTEMLRNMKNMGMTLERAVFDRNYGAIIRFPSKIVHDIMRIIISASTKSSVILSVATRSISDFLSKTRNIESMLKEMLEEVSSAIKLQASFIAPFICAIVAAMATFIVELLQKIAEFLASIEETFNMGGTFVHSGTVGLGETIGLIKIEQVMPPTAFQLIVGIYMIEIVVILSYFGNGIRNGFDETTRNVSIGKTLFTSLILYSFLLLLALFMMRTMVPVFGMGG